MSQAAPLTRKELFLRACRGESVPRVPVWMMRQAGRYLPEYREIRAKHAFLDVCKTPELAVEVSLQPLRRLGVDAVIVFSDILIPAEAMGLKLELGDAGPNLPEPVRTKADVERLKLFDPESDTGFLPEAIRRIVREIGGDVPVLGFAAAPWTLACYMVEGRTREGFATVKSFLYHEPKTFRQLLHRIAEATIPYLKAQISAGAAAVQLLHGSVVQRHWPATQVSPVPQAGLPPHWQVPLMQLSARVMLQVPQAPPGGPQVEVLGGKQTLPPQQHWGRSWRRTRTFRSCSARPRSRAARARRTRTRR